MPIPRKRRKVAEWSVIASTVFHGVIIALLVFFAAREGYLGKQLRTIAVTMAPKEKPPEPEKPKEPEKKPETPPETPKPEEPKPQLAATPPPTAPPPTTPNNAPPPATTAVAPPAAALPSFAFSDGAKPVDSTSDPVQLYKGFVEFSLRSKWLRPDGIDDKAFTAEVEVRIDPVGQITGTTWKSGSGNAIWDDSVRRALAQNKALYRPPPKTFPGTFLVRFDVVEEADLGGSLVP